jgi:hypothetical protein
MERLRLLTLVADEQISCPRLSGTKCALFRDAFGPPETKAGVYIASKHRRMQALGYSADEIAELHAQGVVDASGAPARSHLSPACESPRLEVIDDCLAQHP